MQEPETGLFSHTKHKINSNLKLIEDLNIRFETTKLLEENIGSTSLIQFLVNFFFFDRSPQAKKVKGKINKWDYIKLKSFCTTTETFNKTKRPPSEWRRYLQIIYPISVNI